MMEIEQPITKTVKGASGDPRTVTTHPAFAQIAASRVSGHTALYDSDFRHNAYMTIKIRTSELHRNLHHDWHFDREEIIEVALSEVQWATFVSAPNMGSGVPCTLQRLNGKQIPQLPDPESRADQFNAEMRNHINQCLGHGQRLKLSCGASMETRWNDHTVLRQ